MQIDENQLTIVASGGVWYQYQSGRSEEVRHRLIKCADLTERLLQIHKRGMELSNVP